MRAGQRLVAFSADHPWLIAGLTAVATGLIVVLVAAPMLVPGLVPFLNPVRVDTDPENMLSKKEAVRVFHDAMKEALALHDMVVVGVVNETDPDGVFNPESLRKVYELTEFAKTLRWPSGEKPGETVGVIGIDLIAPSVVDNIEQGGPGVVKFEWLMPEPPATPEEARAVRRKAERIPFLKDTLVSNDGKALALYLPLTSKDLSSRVYDELRGEIATLQGGERYFITGLPVAEDVFGSEMFVQMAISAPLAMLVIFLLMLAFFRKVNLIISPMLIAIASVIFTMGLLVVTGNTIHIMSSMIPIFIMPIAVLDSVHILSQFFDRYQEFRDRRTTIVAVMDNLFQAMLYTSLTSAAGFISLALTPIPPVQVFGAFVAMGIMYAWVLTVTFVPAYVMLIPERSLANFGMVRRTETPNAGARSWVDRFLEHAGEFAYGRAKVIVVLAALACVVAAYGISRIEINDNPTKWFKRSHPIRVADRVLNEHFAGTYMAYLALRPAGEAIPQSGKTAAPVQAPHAPVLPEGAEPALPAGLGGGSEPALPEGLGGSGEAPALPPGLGGVEEEPETAGPATPRPEVREEVFKNPELLVYIEQLQEFMAGLDAVGKSNSLADIVKTVHRELKDGTPEAFRIPDSRGAVAETLVQYASSHRPQDLWHFVTPDYRTTSLWVQLKSGDNRDMSRIAAAVDQYLKEHPLPPAAQVLVPEGLDHEWFGLTYINVVWQDRMVRGMLVAFLGSFLVVMLMMIVLFRSGLWGFLSMIPLTLTLALIYGALGLIGKDYDMPVAVLSSLTLGLAVDFAIHFLSQVQALYAVHGSWAATHSHVFAEPARAITRNVIVIALGFVPLLFAPLVPYVTVGVFMATILFVSGAATLLLMPALVRLLEPLLFPKTRLCALTCRCGTCIVTAVTAVAVVVVNVGQFVNVGWTAWSWISLAAVAVLAAACAINSRRAKCRVDTVEPAAPGAC